VSGSNTGVTAGRPRRPDRSLDVVVVPAATAGEHGLSTAAQWLKRRCESTVASGVDRPKPATVKLL